MSGKGPCSRFSLWLLVLVAVALPVRQAMAESDSPVGQWYGTWTADFPVGPWASPEFPTGNIFEMLVTPAGPGQLVATLYIPELGLFDATVPVHVSGNQLAIGSPAFAFGTLEHDSIAGLAFVQVSTPPFSFIIAWQAQRETEVFPGPPPVAACAEVPELYCTGSAETCTELGNFSPTQGPGYLDYLVKDETWGNQYRSFLRRDFRQLVSYASAQVACQTSDWEYGNFAPVGLGDMSLADGTAPTGFPGHSTHEDGNHIDIAYFQRYAPDNLLRPIGRHHLGLTEVFRLTGRPYALDVWRTALFVAYLSEHPHLRYILVDGEIGGVLESALLDLESAGWIDAAQPAIDRIIYEMGVTRQHHDHMHVAMHVLEPVVAELRIEPKTVNRKSRGRFITAYVELISGYDPADIDPGVGLIVDGSTLFGASNHRASVTDDDGDGVPELAVKFDRQALQESARGAGPLELTLIGSVNGAHFQASDTIVIRVP